MGRIAVTGFGVVTPLGIGASENRKGLQNGLCGFSSLEFSETRYANDFPFGEIKLGQDALRKETGLSDKSLNRPSLFGMMAAREAVEMAAWTPSRITHSETAIAVGNTVGGMGFGRALYNDANHPNTPSPYIRSYDNASVTLSIALNLGISGPGTTINTACSSGSNAILFGARLIKAGLAKRVIAGGADCISGFTINGFHALNILDKNHCRPFDVSRAGLNLGEGAGFVTLEREEDIRDKTVYGFLSGFGNAIDAFHPSSLSPDGAGPCSVMNQALMSAAKTAPEIDLVFAHGTGTENNDLVEGISMKKTFGQAPPFISIKSRIGHTLGAAGAIEAVFSLLALHHGEIYASAGFSNPIPETGCVPQNNFLKKSLRNVLCNAFGFGGNCTSLLFSKQ